MSRTQSGVGKTGVRRTTLYRDQMTVTYGHHIITTAPRRWLAVLDARRLLLSLLLDVGPPLPILHP